MAEVRYGWSTCGYAKDVEPMYEVLLKRVRGLPHELRLSEPSREGRESGTRFAFDSGTVDVRYRREHLDQNFYGWIFSVALRDEKEGSSFGRDLETILAPFGFKKENSI